MSGAAIIAELAGQGAETFYNWWQTGRKERREDDAIWRRTQDMKRSGLNPILAAGNPAQASAANSASIDTNMAQNILAGQELKKLKLENKGIETANNISSQQLTDLVQEYNERMRNINWYKTHDMPSDKPSQPLNDAAQIINAIKNNDTGTAIGASIDKAKQFTSDYLNDFKNELSSYNNWVYNKAPVFLAKMWTNGLTNEDFIKELDKYNVTGKRRDDMLKGRKK